MTPKEKAEELVNELIHYSSTNQKPSLENAKESALIAVDEIIEEVREYCDDNFLQYRLGYWGLVKIEIINL